MIELLKYEYCEECPYFDPDSDSTIVRNWQDGEPCVIQTSVFCRHFKTCKDIEAYLKEKIT